MKFEKKNIKSSLKLKFGPNVYYVDKLHLCDKFPLSSSIYNQNTTILHNLYAS